MPLPSSCSVTSLLYVCVCGDVVWEDAGWARAALKRQTPSVVCLFASSAFSSSIDDWISPACLFAALSQCMFVLCMPPALHPLFGNPPQSHDGVN